MESLIYTKNGLIFGCGNILFGDDAFGPKVIEHIHTHCTLPENVLALDAGTAIRDFIFDLILLESKPEFIWIVDALTVKDRSHGDVFEIDLSEIPKNKRSDFSLHQSPSTNLLSQLKDTGVDVRMLGMQTPHIPNEIQPGLSPEAQKAIPVACDLIMKNIKSRKSFKIN
jgi:coenzyme F420 hydrogenase subunit delta